MYWKEGIKRSVVVPRDTQLPEFVILNNLKTLGISRKQYLEFMEKRELEIDSRDFAKAVKENKGKARIPWEDIRRSK